mmetsp:Transcript_14202/g.26825  ORF Transcript_14202/g.26825 Transcript_14202/m.26825 type:complete len:290 (-) Transcript_14202:222-1091(-)
MGEGLPKRRAFGFYYVMVLMGVALLVAVQSFSTVPSTSKPLGTRRIESFRLFSGDNPDGNSKPGIEGADIPEKRGNPRKKRKPTLPGVQPGLQPERKKETMPIISIEREGIPTDVPIVGDPQKQPKKEYSIDTVLQELAEMQKGGPKKYCILGTRHCSFGHQQIVELLAYALVLSGNHVYTSGAGGTNAAAIRGALRADDPGKLTVILPQSLGKQPRESQELLRKVEKLVQSPQNDDKELAVAAKLCNSNLLSRVQQLIVFAYHDSETVINAAMEAIELDILVTIMYLD